MKVSRRIISMAFFMVAAGILLTDSAVSAGGGGTLPGAVMLPDLMVESVAINGMTSEVVLKNAETASFSCSYKNSGGYTDQEVVMTWVISGIPAHIWPGLKVSNESKTITVPSMKLPLTSI